jgi:hypothetical protein
MTLGTGILRTDGGTTLRAAYMQGIDVVQPFSYRVEVRSFSLMYR